MFVVVFVLRDTTAGVMDILCLLFILNGSPTLSSPGFSSAVPEEVGDDWGSSNVGFSQIGFCSCFWVWSHPVMD